MADTSIFNISPTSLTLGAVLARTATGTVLYEAELLQCQRTFPVAVKQLSISGASAAAEAAFFKEVHIAQLASATCQRACRMLGCYNLNGNPCLVMSLYPSSAAKRLETLQGPMRLQEVVSMAVEILEVVLALHTTWQTGEGFGPRGSYTDVWGFATTILHMATGQVPYSGLTLHQMLTAMIRQRPPVVPDSLPGWLQQVLSQCLSFNTAARPSVQQLLQAFQEQQQQQQQQQQAESVPQLQQQTGSSTLLSSTSQGSYQGNKDAVVASDALRHLVLLLRDSSQGSVQEQAAATLANIASGSEQNKDAVVAVGQQLQQPGA
ncbi:hypothetical protein WJX82_001199 [Trebouxia sp. C0006]